MDFTRCSIIGISSFITLEIMFEIVDEFPDDTWDWFVSSTGDVVGGVLLRFHGLVRGWGAGMNIGRRVSSFVLAKRECFRSLV